MRLRICFHKVRIIQEILGVRWIGAKNNTRLALPFAKLAGAGSATGTLHVPAFAVFAAKVAAKLLLSLTHLPNASKPLLRDETKPYWCQ
jgi:hypothetical protein